MRGVDLSDPAMVPSAGRGTVYSYRAARADGAVVRGALTAESRDEAARILTERGVFPLELRVERDAHARRARLAVADLALGLRVLATLLESGLPVSRALAALDELAPGSWSAMLPALLAAVREGRTLGAAMAAAPVDVPPVVIGMIEASEGGSGLALAVRRAADLMERTARTRAAIRGALAYPLILAAAGGASVALLVGYVLPRFGAILADLGQTLPPTTRIVLDVATLARALAVPGALVVTALLVLGRAWVRTPSGARRCGEFLLALPVIGAIRRAAATARGAAALAALLESGVPMSRSLVHAARATGDPALSLRLLAARERIVVGERIARALAEQDAMTPTAIRLVRAGEESGALASMLAHAALLEQERVERLVGAAVRMLEPALIVGFGGIVALVAAALLQAIYSVRPT